MCRWLCRLPVGAVSASQRHPSFHLPFISLPSLVASPSRAVSLLASILSAGSVLVPPSLLKPPEGHTKRQIGAFLTVAVLQAHPSASQLERQRGRRVSGCV
jgi:hypothetical protein